MVAIAMYTETHEYLILSVPFYFVALTCIHWNTLVLVNEKGIIVYKPLTRKRYLWKEVKKIVLHKPMMSNLKYFAIHDIYNDRIDFMDSFTNIKKSIEIYHAIEESRDAY